MLQQGLMEVWDGRRGKDEGRGKGEERGGGRERAGKNGGKRTSTVIVEERV